MAPRACSSTLIRRTPEKSRNKPPPPICITYLVFQRRISIPADDPCRTRPGESFTRKLCFHGLVRIVSSLAAQTGRLPRLRSDRFVNKGLALVRAEGDLCRKSSKRVQTEEPIVLVPCLRYLIDFIMRAWEFSSRGSAGRYDPVKDSKPSIASGPIHGSFLCPQKERSELMQA